MALAGKRSSAGDRVPRLGPDVDPTALALTPSEGYLLSRVDGRTPWRVLREIGGLAPEEVDRCLERWLAERVLVLDGAGARGRAPGRANGASPQAPLRPEATTQPPPREAPAATPDGAAFAAADAAAMAALGLPAVDESLDLPIAVQEKLLGLAARLDAPYHEILGVAPDADRKALKRAYFALSKELHPDRYFRKQLGAFQPQLERVYKKVVEAYELLSDPMARAEIEKSLAAGASAGAVATAGGVASSAEQAPARPLAARRPHVFSIAERVRKERRQRAKRLFEAGMAAFANGRWVEAAGGVRLAIAFDPWNAAYKERFAEVQASAHQERARQLVKEAESALELRDYPAALRAFEEALAYRPGDGDLLRRAARLALLAGGDLRQAKEWALEAVEIDGRDPAARKLLGQIYKAAGLEANARRELELAVQLDPKDEEARGELRGLGGARAALRWLGGKR